jgi:hypothetical protein
MALQNRINDLDSSEESVLQQSIQDFLSVVKFSSDGQQNARIDFETLLHSKKITMRILCKLSEWCHTDHTRSEGKSLAIEISKILFGSVVPELDGHEIKIEDGKISII